MIGENHDKCIIFLVAFDGEYNSTVNITVIYDKIKEGEC